MLAAPIGAASPGRAEGDMGWAAAGQASDASATAASRITAARRAPPRPNGAILTPSPGTPGEGRGEGLLAECPAKPGCSKAPSKWPSPQPSPGVPGEGARARV